MIAGVDDFERCAKGRVKRDSTVEEVTPQNIEPSYDDGNTVPFGSNSRCSSLPLCNSTETFETTVNGMFTAGFDSAAPNVPTPSQCKANLQNVVDADRLEIDEICVSKDAASPSVPTSLDLSSPQKQSAASIKECTSSYCSSSSTSPSMLSFSQKERRPTREPSVESTTPWQSPGSSQTTRYERLLVVANRLPMTITPPHSGSSGYTFAVSNGGLVSGLRGIKGVNFIWIGWPGTQVPLADRAFVIRECQKCGCHPVFLDRATIDLFYNGFCNNVLWPLIHYIPPPMEVGCNDTHAEQWEAYCRANVSFVEAILEVYDDNDIVWIHDYHLMLVPKLLRSKKPDARIGWFLHTPFPSQEVFRMLPYRTELLTGLLSANLIGFHVYDYLRHFLSSCVQLLGLESTAQGIDATPVGGVFVNCGAIPIGIETQQFTKKLRDSGVVEAIRRLKAQFGRRKVILGVDRLDYMKGLPHKLNAFDRFLELYPTWNERCVLVQLAVPSRTLVPEYQRLKSTVHELVGMINGRRGNLTHVPVHYLDQSLSFDELVALYRVADVALITSLRDGMNLVAYEFIACQAGKYGVLILSEFAGAAQSLGAGSIRVNPWNLDETAEAIHRALSMSKAERRSRHDYAMSHVLTHTSQKWAEIFIESLRDASERSEQVKAAIPPPLDWNEFLEKFAASKRRLIIIDLLDALTPARGNRGMPMKRFKRLIHLPHVVLEALNTLSQNPSIVLIVTTPHPSATLERLFANTKICLAAEKGCVYRNRQGEWVRFIEERTGSSSGLNLSGNPSIASNTNNPSAATATLTSTEIHRASFGMSSSNNTLQNGTSFSTAPAGMLSQKLKSESGTPLAAPKIPTSESSPAIERSSVSMTTAVATVYNEWSSGVEKVFEFFQRRTPGSYTERTIGTLTWYWDDTLPDFGKQQSRDLLVHLWAGPLANASSADVEVVVGPRFIEVRSPLCSRVKLMQHILEHEFGLSDPTSQLDFVACIGNFPRRDEDVHLLFEQGVVAVPRENSNWSELSSASPLGTVLQNSEALTDEGLMNHGLSASSNNPSSASVTILHEGELSPSSRGNRRNATTELRHTTTADNTPCNLSSSAPPVATGRSTSIASYGTGDNCQRRLSISVSPDLTLEPAAAATATQESSNGAPLGLAYYSVSVGAGLICKARFSVLSAYHVQALVRDMALCSDLPSGTSVQDVRKIRPSILTAPPLAAAAALQNDGLDLQWKPFTPSQLTANFGTLNETSKVPENDGNVTVVTDVTDGVQTVPVTSTNAVENGFLQRLHHHHHYHPYLKSSRRIGRRDGILGLDGSLAEENSQELEVSSFQGLEPYFRSRICPTNSAASLRFLNNTGLDSQTSRLTEDMMQESLRKGGIARTSGAGFLTAPNFKSPDISDALPVPNSYIGRIADFGDPTSSSSSVLNHETGHHGKSSAASRLVDDLMSFVHPPSSVSQPLWHGNSADSSLEVLDGIVPPPSFALKDDTLIIDGYPTSRLTSTTACRQMDLRLIPDRGEFTSPQLDGLINGSATATDCNTFSSKLQAQQPSAIAGDPLARGNLSNNNDTLEFPGWMSATASSSYANPYQPLPGSVSSFMIQGCGANNDSIQRSLRYGAPLGNVAVPAILSPSSRGIHSSLGNSVPVTTAKAPTQLSKFQITSGRGPSDSRLTGSIMASHPHRHNNCGVDAGNLNVRFEKRSPTVCISEENDQEKARKALGETGIRLQGTGGTFTPRGLHRNEFFLGGAPTPNSDTLQTHAVENENSIKTHAILDATATVQAFSPHRSSSRRHATIPHNPKIDTSANKRISGIQKSAANIHNKKTDGANVYPQIFSFAGSIAGEFPLVPPSQQPNTHLVSSALSSSYYYPQHGCASSLGTYLPPETDWQQHNVFRGGLWSAGKGNMSGFFNTIADSGNYSSPVPDSSAVSGAIIGHGCGGNHGPLLVANNPTARNRVPQSSATSTLSRRFHDAFFESEQDIPHSHSHHISTGLPVQQELISSRPASQHRQIGGKRNHAAKLVTASTRTGTNTGICHNGVSNVQHSATSMTASCRQPSTTNLNEASDHFKPKNNSYKQALHPTAELPLLLEENLSILPPPPQDALSSKPQCNFILSNSNSGNIVSNETPIGTSSHPTLSTSVMNHDNRSTAAIPDTSTSSLVRPLSWSSTTGEPVTTIIAPPSLLAEPNTTSAHLHHPSHLRHHHHYRLPLDVNLPAQDIHITTSSSHDKDNLTAPSQCAVSDLPGVPVRQQSLTGNTSVMSTANFRTQYEQQPNSVVHNAISGGNQNILDSLQSASETSAVSALHQRPVTINGNLSEAPIFIVTPNSPFTAANKDQSVASSFSHNNNIGSNSSSTLHNQLACGNNPSSFTLTPNHGPGASQGPSPFVERHTFGNYSHSVSSPRDVAALLNGVPVESGTAFHGKDSPRQCFATAASASDNGTMAPIPGLTFSSADCRRDSSIGSLWGSHQPEPQLDSERAATDNCNGFVPPSSSALPKVELEPLVSSSSFATPTSDGVFNDPTRLLSTLQQSLPVTPLTAASAAALKGSKALIVPDIAQSQFQALQLSSENAGDPTNAWTLQHYSSNPEIGSTNGSSAPFSCNRVDWQHETKNPKETTTPYPSATSVYSRLPNSN